MLSSLRPILSAFSPLTRSWARDSAFSATNRISPASSTRTLRKMSVYVLPGNTGYSALGEQRRPFLSHLLSLSYLPGGCAHCHWAEAYCPPGTTGQAPLRGRPRKRRWRPPSPSPPRPPGASQSGHCGLGQQERPCHTLTQRTACSFPNPNLLRGMARGPSISLGDAGDRESLHPALTLHSTQLSPCTFREAEV